LTGAYVEKLFHEWKSRQVQRYDDWVRRGRALEPDWSKLGLRDRDDVERALDALITSLSRGAIAEVAALAVRCWETIPGRDEHRQQHLRRYLAIEMSNRLVYKSPEKRVVMPPVRPAVRAEPAVRTGEATPAYTAFVGPFLDGHLGAIKRHLTPIVLRPPLHGDRELEATFAAT
jgi:hypothetical protein